MELNVLPLTRPKPRPEDETKLVFGRDFTDRMFVSPVRRAIFRWKFVPQLVNGQPVPFTGLWEFPFTLAD